MPSESPESFDPVDRRTAAPAGPTGPDHTLPSHLVASDAATPDLAATDLGGGLRMQRALDSLASEGRTDEAARSRTRRRWLQRQAVEDSSVHGVLLDLAEQGARVVVQSVSGRQHVGIIHTVARDFCGLRLDTGHDILLRVTTVEIVRQLAGAAVPGEHRPPRAAQAFETAVATLGETQPEVALSTTSGERLRGRLVSVGRDIARLDLAGSGGTAFVPLEAIVEIGLC